MKRLYLGIICFLMGMNGFGQAWEWSKLVPKIDNFYFTGYSITQNDEMYFTYKTGYAAIPQKFKILHQDVNGSILDSLTLNIDVKKFQIDKLGNYILSGTYVDSFTYGGQTVFSRGGRDNFILKISQRGNLIFLQTIGNLSDESELRGITVNSFGKTLICSVLEGTIFVGNNLLERDTAFDQIAIIILNQDGTLNSYKKVSFTFYHNADGIYVDEKDRVFLITEYCYPNECPQEKTQFSSNLDSINTVPEGMIDPSQMFVYLITNPTNHYGYDPVLNKYRLSDKKIIWKQELGGIYQCYQLSALLLPGDKILTYGRGGGAWGGGGGTAILDDTSFTYPNHSPPEMLLGLLDTNGHYYFVNNEKIPNTSFGSANYNGNGYVYLLSYWTKDTTYSMGTTFTTSGGGTSVISKLKYLNIPLAVSATIEKTFILYPNPSSGKFTLQFSEPIKEGKVCVYDVLGNCIKEIPLSPPSTSSGQVLVKGESFTLDLSGKAKGIYFVVIDNGVEKVNRKVVLN